MDMHGKYRITNILPTSGSSIAMGVHSEKDRQFATWEVRNGEYLWAHYFKNQQEAVKDLCSRTLREISRIQDKVREENDYTVTVIIRNGKNSAVIEFPTNELQDVLGSIGITEPADKVCIGGAYPIEITPGAGKMEDALNHIFQKGDSLHLVNETARSVYHAAGKIPDSIMNFYIIRYADSGLSPFLEIEIIKTEAVKSISSHNGYKYSDFYISIKPLFTILSSYPFPLQIRARQLSL